MTGPDFAARVVRHESTLTDGYSSFSTSINMRGAASTRQATVATANMSWTTSGYGSTATRWAIVAVPIHPAVEVASHTMTFNANGGTGTMSPQVTNVPTALTANAFTRTDYTFNGWNTAANGSGTSYADGATYSFSADVALYAQWMVKVYLPFIVK